MTRNELTLISNLCAAAEVLINVDAGDEDSHFQDWLEAWHPDFDYASTALKEKLKVYYYDRLRDGANIIDEYRDVCIFSTNFQANHQDTVTENDIVEICLWFWETCFENLLDEDDTDDEDEEEEDGATTAGN